MLNDIGNFLAIYAVFAIGFSLAFHILIGQNVKSMRSWERALSVQKNISVTNIFEAFLPLEWFLVILIGKKLRILSDILVSFKFGFAIFAKFSKQWDFYLCIF
jgi:hypothetical protein